MEERSAGAVVFREGPSGREYLLLKYPAGHWDFPKGNIEKGEAPQETMVREVREETGLRKIRIVEGFKSKIEYYYSRGGRRVHKQVTFFLAEAFDLNEGVVLSFEHREYAWLNLNEAMKVVSYQNSRRLIQAAEKTLAQGAGIERLSS